MIRAPEVGVPKRHHVFIPYFLQSHGFPLNDSSLAR